MKNLTTLAVALLMGIGTVHSQNVDQDSVRTIALEEIEVLSTRANEKTPIAFTNINSAQLATANHGLDLPFLLLNTPGVLTTSDAGAGVGYTGIRIRGTDATRISVTANDIPMNDAESHTIYWVNTPDLASSLTDIQVQRGVGTSTNGAGAFGGSINLRTQSFSPQNYAEVSGSYGSFNTHKETVKVGTGMLSHHWAADLRLSHIGSDGYRDRASSELKSYFAQLGWFTDSTIVRFITFGGKEDTYHAWDGISRDQLKTDRTYNPNGEIKRDGQVVGFYDDQKDIYQQVHYQILAEHRFLRHWKAVLGLHYTDGEGYYQEYKNARTLKEYLLEPVETATGTLKKSSLVRRKAVESDFLGGVAALKYVNEHVKATLGGGWNTYSNDHYGRVLWVENYTAALNAEHEYYRNTGKKRDGNIFVKGIYELGHGLSAYADLQYRHIHYTIKGDNDKWDWTASPEHLQTLDIDETFNFFNPKAGINYEFMRGHRAYASVAVAHKEPTRNNYTDGLFLEHPRAERLVDWELGYNFTSPKFSAGVNFYRMNYKDQLVLNGKLNEIGEAMAENVPHSYRMGVELMAGWQIMPWLRWDANACISQNRIQDYVGYVSDYDNEWNEMWTQTAIECGNTTIAFSPSFIGNNAFTFNYKGFGATLQTQVVSRQYLDNMERRDDSLDGYMVNNLHLNYTFTTPHTREVIIGASIYNLFDTKYETNGYSMTAAVYNGSDKSSGYSLVSDPRFYPMAGINALGHITLKF